LNSYLENAKEEEECSDYKLLLAHQP